MPLRQAGQNGRCLMVDKVKAKFITAIWGARYIEEFARVSLPSYLAPGNLPALAAEVDLEVLVMTTRESRPAFEREPAFAVLGSLCAVRFIYIDDLIASGIYGVTLTLAYARGVRDSGADQIGTWFVFMNSDFVLADGSLKTLAERMRGEERCILAPSLRGQAEKIVPQLRDLVDHEHHTLRMKSREMVALTFANLHPTVIAKTVTQNFAQATIHNQIYWQVDETTLLGRYHLIFMMAIRPEVPMTQVNSYCDYGFVPELVPSGRFSILDDSDAFYMLELQPTEQEREMLVWGGHSTGRIAADLSKWTTREHRRFGEIDVVFHAGDLPPDLPTHQAALGQFMNSVQSQMSQSPRGHDGHFYWTSGVQAWLTLRPHGHELPAELENRAAPLPPNGSAPVRPNRTVSIFHIHRTLLRIAQRWRGQFPEVAVWHHRWVDSRLVFDWARVVSRGKAKRVLLVHPANSTLPGPLGRLVPMDAMEIDRFIQSPPLATMYDDILLHVDRIAVRSAAALLAAARTFIKPGGRIVLYIEHPGGEYDPSRFSFEMAQYLEVVFQSGWMSYVISARFVGGRAKRVLRRIETACMNHLWPGRLRDLPVFVAALATWPVIAVLTAANNLRLLTTAKTVPVFCTSAMVTLTRYRSCSGHGEAKREPAAENVLD